MNSSLLQIDESAGGVHPRTLKRFISNPCKWKIAKIRVKKTNLKFTFFILHWQIMPYSPGRGYNGAKA
jgi:hypothetical protein